MFIDLQKWKKLWCRLIDTYAETDRDKIIAIENRIFCNIKHEIQEETGEWTGSQYQNSLADLKVASSIYKSFQSYENGKKRVGSFFNFRRLGLSQDQKQ